jgi:hypothetical protein
VRHEERVSTYGNTVIENPRITREMVDLAADELGRSQFFLNPAEKQVPPLGD